MGTMYRGEEMVLCQMYLQADSAYNCISQLGELGIVQFKDLNADVNAFQRYFVNDMRRVEEMERILRFFDKELKKANIIPLSDDFDLAAPTPRMIVDMLSLFETNEKELREMSSNVEALDRNNIELIQLQYMLEKSSSFFEEVHDHEITFQEEVGSIEESSEIGRPCLRYTTGVIPMSKLNGFSRMIFFLGRGTIFLRHTEIDEFIVDPVTGEDIKKAVFLAVCSGEQLHTKLRKIAEGFHAAIYPCPETTAERMQVCKGVKTRIEDLKTVLTKSHDQQDRTLRNIARNYNTWLVKVLKLKACFMTMNMLQPQGNSFVAECWMPFNELGTVQGILNRDSEMKGNVITPILASVLPTYHKTNVFTSAFQNIIDAYGTANYREINPALFSIITFPFLFSVMFGDAGHGLVMFCFALFLVLNDRIKRSNQLKAFADSNEIFGLIYGGRYLILMMSIFSIYSGLLYNDVFSKAFAYGGSSVWKNVYSDDDLLKNSDFNLDPNNTQVFTGPPPFALDPVWKLSKNQITFTNSFKKKISVIFGVFQMLLGVLLGFLNHVYFRHYLKIICEFIPMLLFLLSLFGYLCAIMIGKWLLYPCHTDECPTTDLMNWENYYQCSPNLLIGFINMFMLKYDNSENNHCSNHTWFKGQQVIQTTLVILAVICAIWLLLSKPLVLYIRNRRRAPREQGHERLVEEADNRPNQSLDGSSSRESFADRSISVNSDMPSGERRTRQSLTKPVEHEEVFDFGEVFIHQAIHTIEFCLGCVSHTASYLRLWALSLAHAQLSEVLWTMLFHQGFAFAFHVPRAVQIIILFLLFAPFAVLTVVILLVMEGLSAFLHTLRLHWVEFNSKFYGGDGMPFEPFSFDEILKREKED